MNIYVSVLIVNSLHALKGQKLFVPQHALKVQKHLAQGSALGCFGR